MVKIDQHTNDVSPDDTNLNIVNRIVRGRKFNHGNPTKEDVQAFKKLLENLESTLSAKTAEQEADELTNAIKNFLEKLTPVDFLKFSQDIRQLLDSKQDEILKNNLVKSLSKNESWLASKSN